MLIAYAIATLALVPAPHARRAERDGFLRRERLACMPRFSPALDNTDKVKDLQLDGWVEVTRSFYPGEGTRGYGCWFYPLYAPFARGSGVFWNCGKSLRAQPKKVEKPQRV